MSRFTVGGFTIKRLTTSRFTYGKSWAGAWPVVAVASLCLTWSTSAAFAANKWSFKITDLGTLGGITSHAASVNSHGDVVGYSETADGRTAAFVWRKGQMTEIRGAQKAMDINDKDSLWEW